MVVVDILRYCGSARLLKSAKPTANSTGPAKKTTHLFAGAYTYHNDESDVNPANGVVDNKDANDRVAVYGDYYDGGWISTGTANEAPVGSLGDDSANELGLYDMSGNIWEWVFTGYGSGRYLRGGYYGNNASYLQVGFAFWGTPADGYETLGFRLCRTAD